MNRIKTVLFLTILTVLFIVIGGALGGRTGMYIALVFAGIMNFASYWFSDKIVLKMYRAQPLDPNSNHRLVRVVRNLAGRAGLPMPKVYIIPKNSPNAFATGRNPKHAAVAATQGILQILDDDELEGVMAHELSHVKHYDILIGSIAATIAGAISILATMARWAAIFGGYGGGDNRNSGGIFGLLAMTIVAPIAALLIQTAISRSREFLADKGGAEMSKKPQALASALEKLHNASRKVPMHANPATAHMFIVNPLRGGDLMSLFSTHPPVEKRIARLRDMSYGY
ncbi:MAG: zinc metalloprotease HtpX [candidate division Zixibacteria bacterium]|nr:zinc metalloprotease HtpX [candidate division Zixibacteria bacterium]NIR63324.1 zinc metalloprotease HtpX [candidate division Zixibacteria bacterium]NIS17319.1 zinc metalloprotease HtpX [candidate division Zixibacteria bacterium]NIS45309.1 zinc metalloprotease HtpX [candidate division Zixibacteria bacterium]NIT53679.1 zinc metalloprotease HtpX [candidate division Zixibacteria bacterium]